MLEKYLAAIKAARVNDEKSPFALAKHLENTPEFQYGPENTPCKQETIAKYINVLKYLEVLDEVDGYLRPTDMFLEYEDIDGSFTDTFRTSLITKLETDKMGPERIRELSHSMLRQDPPVIPNREHLKARLFVPIEGEKNQKCNVPYWLFDPCFSLLWHTGAINRSTSVVYQ